MNDWLNQPVTRRRFLATGLLGGAGLALGGGWTVNLYASAFFDQLTITDYHLASPRWNLPKLTVAFLTDLHVGCLSVDVPKLDGIVAQINALQADLVLLGGDFVTRRDGQSWVKYVAPDMIADKLHTLHAPLGVFSVLGNHDWGVDGMAVWHALQQAGITVMENSAVFVPWHNAGFWLVGLADYLTRRPDYAGSMAQAHDGQPKIVLSHDPYTFKDVTGDPAVQLSGHTHGGQVRLPLIGPVINPTPGSPVAWDYGLVHSNDDTLLVSSGVGTSLLPIKNTPCEVVRLTISPP